MQAVHPYDTYYCTSKGGNIILKHVLELDGSTSIKKEKLKFCNIHNELNSFSSRSTREKSTETKLTKPKLARVQQQYMVNETENQQSSRSTNNLIDMYCTTLNSGLYTLASNKIQLILL